VYVVIRFWEPDTDTGYTILIHGLIHRLEYIRITILCHVNIVMTIFNKHGYQVTDATSKEFVGIKISRDEHHNLTTTTWTSIVC
jgi:hypothetical protein